MHRWTDKISKNRRKCWELSARLGQLAREEWLFCSTRPPFKEITILWRNPSILSDESTTIRVNVRLHRKSEKQRQIQLTNIHGYPHRPYQSSGFIFLNLQFVCHCDLWTFLPSSRNKISVALRLFLIGAKDSLRVAECNQDFLVPTPCCIPLWAAGLVTPFVTPAPYHMPIEVVSVKVREHPHQERTPQGVVFDKMRKESEWRYPREAAVEPSVTMQLSMRDRDEEMSRQNRKECDQIFRTEARILSIFWKRMICLWNSDEEIAIVLGNSSILN